MKRFLFSVLRGLLRFIYAVLKLLFPVRDRVLFISRESDNASANFLLIAEEIRKRSPHTDLRFSCKKDRGDKLGLNNMFLMLDRMRLMAGSRVCITESESAEFGMLDHRRELRIIQIWHSMAPFRRFGWQTVGLPEGMSLELAEGAALHAGYDHIIVGSSFAADIFSKAMNTDVSKILPLGLPVADMMFGSDGESDRFKLWRLHPSTCGKRVIVYAPTLRFGKPVPCEEFISAVDFETTSLVVKLHPRDSLTVIEDDRVIVDTEMTIQEAVRAADIIITDYSGVSAEASLLDKPVAFYTPDLEDYSGFGGLNINPAELFPKITFDRAEALMAAIDRGIDHTAVAEMREKLAGACKGDSARSIAYLATETSIQNTASSLSDSESSRIKSFFARCIYTVKYLGFSIDPKLILFESKNTRGYKGDVRELYEAVIADKKFENCRFAWAVSNPDEADIPASPSCLTVVYGSSEHMQLHARAKVVISDAPVSGKVRLRSEQHYFIADGSTKELLRRIIG